MAVFLDPQRDHFQTDEYLKRRFPLEMTLESYAETSRMLLAEILTSSQFGLELETFTLQVSMFTFWRLHLPEGDAVAQYAAHYRYLMPLNEDAYEMAGLSVPSGRYTH